MKQTSTKTIVTLFILFSVVLFGGNIVINLFSDIVGNLLKSLLGENYSLIILIISLVLFIIAGIAAWLQLKSNQQSQSTPMQIQLGNKETNLETTNQINTIEIMNKSINEFINHIETLEDTKYNYRQDPRPMEIISKVQESQPFQRIALEQNYKGLRVAWYLLYQDIYENKQEYGIHLRDPENYLILISSTIDIDNYPEIKIIDKGHKVIVLGNISNVDADVLTISLVDTKYKFM